MTLALPPGARIAEVTLRPVHLYSARWCRHPDVRLLTIAASVILVAGIPQHAIPSVRRHQVESPGIDRYEYVSPRPGSALVSRWNTIVLRQGSAIDEGSLAPARFSVAGASSGPHMGAFVLSDDSKTIVFKPVLPFAPGEQVEVLLEGGIRTIEGEELPGLAFHFSVAQGDPGQPWEPGLGEQLSDEFSSGGLPEAGAAGGAVQNLLAIACGPLPSSYPPISLLLSNNPEPGYVFLSPFRTVPPGHLVIVDNLGNPIFYRRLVAPSTDFKLQPDGRLTYFSRPSPGAPGKFIALDASYGVVDSFATGNGYITDSHDLQLLPNGHALLMSYDPQTVRMDTVVSGGRSNARVVGLIIQELDAGKNVVFQWRSWDHFAITDVASPSVVLTGLMIDYVHGNALELDHDGNLLISSRHLNEITKISRQTGEILWRMGPNARNNQFAFANDTRGFSHQHDIRRLPNGHITLFDNGNFLTPQFSRALEYEIDEAGRRATLVWEFRNAPDTYGSFMGNAQRRAGGGTMIGWGGTNPNPKLTDLHPDGSKALELGMASGTWSYRAFRFPWRTNRFVTDATSLDFGQVLLGGTASLSVWVSNPSPIEVTIDCVSSTDSAFVAVAPIPASLAPGASMAVEIRFSPKAEAHYAAKLYIRSTGAEELIAQDVEVAGTGVINRSPDCRQARATPPSLWPPSHELVPVAIEGVSDPDGDPVTIEISSITQDEDLGGADAPECPDAVVENGVAWVRAERAGQGDGRVYRIGFTARDPSGAACESAVSVCVPHDRGSGASAGAVGIRRDSAPEVCEDEASVVNSLGPCSGPERQRLEERASGSGPALEAGVADRTKVTVEFTLHEDSDVTLAVYDLAGRRVAILESGRRAAGSHRVEWSTTGVSAGIYFCRIRAGRFALNQPLLVVR